MNKHTQGPWVVGRGATVYGADGYEIADAAQGPHLHASHAGADGHWASTLNAHIERDEDEEFANARLMAAAPELLEACRGLLTLTQLIANEAYDDEAMVEFEVFNETTKSTRRLALADELDKARAAIAKAEGGKA